MCVTADVVQNLLAIGALAVLSKNESGRKKFLFSRRQREMVGSTCVLNRLATSCRSRAARALYRGSVCDFRWS